MHRKEVHTNCQYPTSISKSLSEAKATLRLPELPTKPEKSCFPSMTRKPRITLAKKKWSIRKSCCPQMLHPNMQTEQPSGTPLKKSKSNGTHSLQDGLLPPCPEKSRWSCYRRWSKNTARNSLFQRECVVISQSMTPIRRDTIPIAISC